MSDDEGLSSPLVGDVKEGADDVPYAFEGGGSIDISEFSDARGKEIQRELTGELLMSMISPEEAKSSARTAVKTLFCSLRSWTDASGARKLLDLIGALSSGAGRLRSRKARYPVSAPARNVFVECFSSRFRAEAAALIKAKSRDYSLVSRLVAWGFAFFSGACADFESVLTNAKIPAALARLMDLLASAPDRDLAKADAAVRSVLGRDSNGQDGAVQALRKAFAAYLDKKPANRLMTLRALGPGLPQRPWMSRVLVDIISKGGTASRHVLAPLLQSVGADAFRTQAIPAITQALKRTPDATIATLTELARAAPFDMSDALSASAALLTAELQSPKRKRRKGALQCIEAVSNKSSDSKALSAALTGLGLVVSGKKSKPPAAWEARESVVLAIDALGRTSAVGSKTLKELSTRPILDLLSLMKKEPQDEVRAAALRVIVEWTVRRQEVPQKVLSRFKKGFAAKDNNLDRNIVAQYAWGVMRLARAGLVLPFDGADALSAHYAQCARRLDELHGAAQRPAAVGALSVLVDASILNMERGVLGAAGADVKAVATDPASWDAALRSPDSVVVRPSAVLASTECVAQCQIAIASSLLAQHWDAAKPQPHTPYSPPPESDAKDAKTGKNKRKKKSKRSEKPKRKNASGATADKKANASGKSQQSTDKVYTRVSLKSSIMTSPYGRFLRETLRLFMHTNASIRRTCAQRLEALVQSTPRVATALLPALIDLFDTLVSERDAAQRSVTAEMALGADAKDDDKEEDVLQVDTASCATKALVAVAGSVLKLNDPAMTSFAVLAAHHPILKSRPKAPRARCAAWRSLVSRWSRGAAERKRKVKGAAAAFATQVLDDAARDGAMKTLLSSVDALRSPTAPRRQAASALVATLCYATTAAARTAAIPSVFGILTSGDVTRLTPFERAVATAAPGTVVDEAGFSEGGRPEYATSKNVRTTRNGAYSAEDEAWAREEAEKEAAAKREAEKAAKKEKDLVIQASMRLRIQNQVIGPMRNALEAAARAASWFPRAFHDQGCLDAIAPAARRCAAEKIISGPARAALFSMGNCVRWGALGGGGKGCSLPRPVLDAACRAVAYVASIAQYKPSQAEQDGKMDVTENVLNTAAAIDRDTSFGALLESPGAAKGVASALDALFTFLSNTASADNGSQVARVLRAPSLRYFLPLCRVAVASAARPNPSTADKKALKIDIELQRTGALLICHHAREGAEAASPRAMLASLLLQVLASNQRAPIRLRRRVRNALFKVGAVLEAKDLGILLGPFGILGNNLTAKLAALNALVLRPRGSLAPLGASAAAPVWCATFDADEFVRRAAKRAWRHGGCLLPSDYATDAFGLMAMLCHSNAGIRAAAGEAVAAALKERPETAAGTIKALIDMFQSNPDEVITVAPTDGTFREQKERIDRSTTRTATAVCIAACAPYLMASGEAAGRGVVRALVAFFIETGLRDASSTVWSAVLDSALAIISSHGKRHADCIIPRFEAELAMGGAADEPADVKSKGKKGRRSEAARRARDAAHLLREGAVICLGHAARFLPRDSDKVAEVVDLLISMLDTPSYGVQIAVSECLVHLMPSAADAGASVERWVQVCVENLSSVDYGVRKGAAFGLAGLIKGLGMPALRQYGVMAELTKRVSDDKDVFAREGALFAYERLFAMFGFHFEPFLLHVLPHILKTFGDQSREVRHATQEAARAIMASVTSNGMKLVMPLVLRSLQDRKWRTKVQSIGLLGAMSHCSAEQLSQMLPTVVPRLLQCLRDANAEVQKASRRALKGIGDAINNPEIRAVVSTLLAALARPPSHTQKALEKLMATSFVHSIDAASLALVAPIVLRGLRDRDPKSKQMAAQITGSICSLTADVADLKPYAAKLINHLKAILIDYTPAVRRVAARALGSLYKGLGETAMPGIMDYLMSILKGENNTAAQRSGGALGIAQLLLAMGGDGLQRMLPLISNGVKEGKPPVREGFVSLYVSIPEAFGPQFLPHVAGAIETTVGLFDDISAKVRTVSLEAAQNLAILYSDTNQIESVLPALEAAMRHPKWRCRMGACHVMGTYLCQLGGATGQVYIPSSEGDEATDTPVEEGKDGAKLTTKDQHEQMTQRIGRQRRDRVLSLIYLMQSEANRLISHTAWRVWKAVVIHSPATLSSIFPTLISRIIESLASHDSEEQAAAGEALGGIVKKMGAAVLRDIVPLLRSRLTSDDEATRRGVCLGLSEVMKSTAKKRIGEYTQELISAVRDALCDEAEAVREAAGSAFQTLHTLIGQQAIDEIVPALVQQLKSAALAAAGGGGDVKAGDSDETDEEDGPIDSDLVLAGIRQILTTHSRVVLPFLIPQLAKRPMSVFRAQALASLAGALGSSFYRYIEDITKAFVDAAEASALDGNLARRSEYVTSAALVNAALHQDAILTLVSTLTKTLYNPDPEAKRTQAKLAAAELLGRFCSETECDLKNCLESILQASLSLFAHSDTAVLKRAAATAAAAIKHIPKPRIPDYISFVDQIFKDLSTDHSGNRIFETLPGLGQRTALRPFIPLVTEGLMKGSERTKQAAASTMGTLISLTSIDALRPYVMLIAGPLIRMASEQFSEGVKLAILTALRLLLEKCGLRVKAFFSALQTTFRKALHHISAKVRDEAVRGLAQMMRFNPRVDNVIQDLQAQVEKEALPRVRLSLLQALDAVVSHKPTGARASKPLLSKTLQTVRSSIAHADEDVRLAAGQCFGSLAQHLEGGDLVSALRKHILGSSSGGWAERQGRATAIGAVARAGRAVGGESARAVEAYIRDENLNVRVAALCCAGAALASGEEEAKVKSGLLQAVGGAVLQHTGVVQLSAIRALQAFAHRAPDDAKRLAKGVAKPLLDAFPDAKSEIRDEIRVSVYLLVGGRSESDAAKLADEMASEGAGSVGKALLAFAKKALAKLSDADVRIALDALKNKADA